MNWTVTENADWFSASPVSGSGNATITITYNANSGSTERTGTITITATGASGSPKTVQITQEGIQIQPVLSVGPALREVSASSGTVTFDIANTGTGTMNWTVAENADWFFG